MMGCTPANARKLYIAHNGNRVLIEIISIVYLAYIE